LRPILLDFTLPLLGRTTLPAYFTLLTIGFGMAMLLTVREARKLDLDPQEVLDINLYMVIFGILGSRVLHIFADGHFMDYVNLCVDPMKVPAIDALVSRCNSAKECGFIMASGYCIYYTRKHKIPTMKIGDLAAPGIMLGLFFGRMGCYLNGCCHGKETASFVGTRFPMGSGPWRQQYEAHLIQVYERMRPVHPTQLYESIGCLLLFAILYFYVRPRRRHFGQVFGWMMILYGVLRSLCEIFRDDERGVLWGWLSTSQMISVPLLIAGTWLVLRKPRSPAWA
jgi:phosphatidylglycerol:prolipoprotein diacylglycerol transferase